MPELEKSISEWRSRMTAALPQHEEAVAELEEHLREHLACLQRQGKSDDEAFALAQERLGDPRAVAREFSRMPVGWWPARILLPALALLLALFVGLALWNWSRRMPVTALQLVFHGTYITGFFGVLGSGLIAASALVTTWRRPLRERERCAVRALLKKLAWVAAVAIPVGIVLGSIWRAQLIPNHWTLWSHHLRLMGPAASVALLFFAQSRTAANERRLWVMAIFASFVLFFSCFGPSIRVADIPVAWLCVVFLLGQVFLVLPRFRIVRVR
jgi:hypothetical protein